MTTRDEARALAGRVKALMRYARWTSSAMDALATVLAAALDAARADERERCAKIAESDRTHKTDDGWRTSTAIAAEIRAAAPEAKETT